MSSPSPLTPAVTVIADTSVLLAGLLVLGGGYLAWQWLQPKRRRSFR